MSVRRVLVCVYIYIYIYIIATFPHNIRRKNNNTRAVTLPSGVHGGDVIHVKAPDGRINAIIVPMGMGPGSTFTVEFAASSDDYPEGREGKEDENAMAPGVYVPVVVAEQDVTDTNMPAAVARPTSGPFRAYSN